MELGPLTPSPLTPSVALAETCRIVGGVVPLWAYHRERLHEGGCPEALLLKVERALADAIATGAVACEGATSARTSRLRAHIEVGADGDVSVEVERRLSSLDVVNGPLLVPVSTEELPAPPTLPPRAAKPADRSWWDEAARIARSRRGHHALIVDGDGFVVDGSSATVWIVRDGTIVTAPSPPAVAGVARRFVLARAMEIGLEAHVRPLRAEEVGSADKVFLTNAFGGAVAVRGCGGTVTDRVRELFNAVWRPGAAS